MEDRVGRERIEVGAEGAASPGVSVAPVPYEIASPATNPMASTTGTQSFWRYRLPSLFVGSSFMVVNRYFPAPLWFWRFF